MTDLTEKAAELIAAHNNGTAAPGPVTIAAPEQQISAALVDTPAGQRLAIGIVTLLDPASAKSLADAIGQAAGSMSATRLVVANGVIK